MINTENSTSEKNKLRMNERKNNKKQVMKKFFLIAVTMMVAIVANAQKFTVTGTVLDKETKETVLLAAVSILDAENNDKCVAGAATDSSGVFTVKDLQKGKYKVRVSYVGYKPKVIPFTLSESGSKRKTDLGFITLDTKLGLGYLENSASDKDKLRMNERK